MLNKIYLEPGEKTTVIGGRFNYVSIAYYSISLRILDHYNREIDFFDNVTGGFKFGNPDDKIGRVEITNTSENCQNVEIYSGELEVEKKNITNQIGYSTKNINGIAGEYSYLGIENLTRKTIEIISSSTISTSVYFGWHNTINVIPGMNFSNIFTSKNSIISNINFCYGYHTNHFDLTGATKIMLKNMQNYSDIKTRSFFLPPNNRLICCSVNTNIGLNINFKCRF